MPLFRAMVRLVPLLRWAALLAVALVLSLVLFPQAVAADGPLDQQARDIARELQCPICENNSVADSPSELAAQMRALIQEQLATGRTRQEILDYFVARYGQSVLRDPPKEGFALLVWGVPPLLFLVGAALVVRMLRGALAQPRLPLQEEPPLSDEERGRLEQVLAQEVQRGVEGHL